MIMNSVPWIPYILFHFMFLRLCSSLDTISVSQPIRDGDGGGDVLATIGETFALGFFSPGKSNYRYVGIWYHKITEKQLSGLLTETIQSMTPGFLSIDTQGNLVLFDSNDPTVPFGPQILHPCLQTSTVAQLLDSGNLVLFQNESKKLLWQSFDYPTDTQLANMKIGLDRRTGLNRFLTSWKSEDDPRIGNYSYRINPAGSPQLILYEGQVPWFRRRYIWYEQERGWQPLLSAPRSRVINMDIAVHLVSVILTILRSLNALVSLGLSPSLTVSGTLEMEPMVVKGNQGH
ncbi:hypothetical protein FNV43_RR01391 [Rhamnella rubrinervis]|uniref:Bulb-type lectin domain-containing protein n=1 Tax=Rhamnella rubrinervis TaxID=2594499 RepID=A0A8K0HPJ8_9ROSA|nr:hypothetical protein FNV43_RR01391 [Rhamnella rubrinervis]